VLEGRSSGSYEADQPDVIGVGCMDAGAPSLDAATRLGPGIIAAALTTRTNASMWFALPAARSTEQPTFAIQP
jgi:hypothetical protein